MTSETLACDDKSTLEVTFKIIFCLFVTSVIKLIVIINRREHTRCCFLWCTIYALEILLFYAAGNLWQSKYCLGYNI